MYSYLEIARTDALDHIGAARPGFGLAANVVSIVPDGQALPLAHVPRAKDGPPLVRSARGLGLVVAKPVRTANRVGHGPLAVVLAPKNGLCSCHDREKGQK